MVARASAQVAMDIQPLQEARVVAQEHGSYSTSPLSAVCHKRRCSHTLYVVRVQEWTDVASRDSAAPFLQQLIALDPTREFDPADHMADDDSSSDEPTGDESSGLQLEGNGGDGVFEGAVVQLVAAMQGTTAGFVAAMLDGIADLAAAAGLMRKPGDGTEEHGRFTGGRVAWQG